MLAIRRLALCVAVLALVQGFAAHSARAAEVIDPHDLAAAGAASVQISEAAPAAVGDLAAAPTGAPSGASATSGAAATDAVATTPDKITIYAILSSFHTDLVLPRSAFDNAPPLIKAAVAKTNPGPWIIVGWGPWWFGRDLKGGPFHPAPVRVASALWTLVIPTNHSQIRMAALPAPAAAPGEDRVTPRPLQITPAGLDHMIKRINASFLVGPDGGPVMGHEGGVAPGVRLFRSTEIYQLAHECNQWAAEVLHAGGIGTTYILDMLPGSLGVDLDLHGTTARPVADVARNPSN